MPSSKNLKVLIVDDQQSMRGLTRHCLREIGVAQVTDAKSGEEALKILGDTNFDLIISDWNMDGISGLELLTKIRGNPVIKKLPFIMATGQRDKDQVKQAIDAGVNNYIVKPFSVADLRKRVAAVLGPLT
jgi:two-component system chemotaxis response regulator CheY